MTISKICVELLRTQAKQVLPRQPSQCDPWLTSQLNGSTLSLQLHRTQAVVILAVSALHRDMASLSVREYLKLLWDMASLWVIKYLKALLLWAYHRGSDVQLRTELVEERSHLRMRAGTGALQDVRLFHIFDSQVAAAAAA